jgi:hypothetical protein
MYVAEAGVHRQNEGAFMDKYSDNIRDVERFARSDQSCLTVK